MFALLQAISFLILQAMAGHFLFIVFVYCESRADPLIQKKAVSHLLATYKQTGIGSYPKVGT